VFDVFCYFLHRIRRVVSFIPPCLLPFCHFLFHSAVSTLFLNHSQSISMSYGNNNESRSYYQGTSMREKNPTSYFTEFTFYKAGLYSVAAIYVVSVAMIAIIQPFLTLPCPNNEVALTFLNPAYDADPCRQMRFAMLFWLSPEECTSARKLVASVLLGGIIGWERRQADRYVYLLYYIALHFDVTSLFAPSDEMMIHFVCLLAPFFVGFFLAIYFLML
jgi:hypothetical protein